MTREPTPVEAFFDYLTAWVGSVPSLIVHTVVFLSAFAVAFFHYLPWDMVLLIVTTVVSLEAIYLAIFIQMTVNRQARELHDVSEDVEEIQEEVGEISKDVDEISEDVEDIAEDVEEMSDDWDLETGVRKSGEVTLDSLHDELKGIIAKIDELKTKG